jgi:hypothetical protein
MRQSRLLAAADAQTQPAREMLLYMRQTWNARLAQDSTAMPICWTRSAKARCCVCDRRR